MLLSVLFGPSSIGTSQNDSDAILSISNQNFDPKPWLDYNCSPILLSNFIILIKLSLIIRPKPWTT